MVGASGAIYGILMAFGMLFPNTKLMLLFPPIPIKAKYFVLILGGFAIYSQLMNSGGDNVAHLAHLGGMLFAFIMIKIWAKDKGSFY
jgi:membrane associated rhomboid family serine protease